MFSFSGKTPKTFTSGSNGSRERRSEEAAGVSERRNVEGWEEADSLGFRRGHQTDFADGHEAAGAAGDQVRAGEWAEERHAGAQGEHPEIYRRCFSRLGL